MTHVTQVGTRILTRPTTNVPGGLAAPVRTRFDHLMAAGRPRWADDPALDLPCQRPDVDPDWWFAAGIGEKERIARSIARMLCGGCPMRRECAAHAIAPPRELYGVWGGLQMERPGRPFPAQRNGAKP